MAERLTRERWVEEGLRVLRDEGPLALAADRLAKRLKVSRGSFYWHFHNVAEFEAAILTSWEERWTKRIIAATRSSGGTPRQQLASLIAQTAGLDAEVYLSAKRLARRHPEHAEIMHRVDESRLSFVTGMLQAGGLSKAAARNRASVIYAWAMGQMLTGAGNGSIPRPIVQTLIDFAFAPEQ